MSMSRGYRKTISKNGEFSPKIRSDIVDMIDIVCRLKGITKTDYVNDVIRDRVTEDYNTIIKIVRNNDK